MGSAHLIAYSTPVFFTHAWRQVLRQFYFIDEESESQGGDLPLPPSPVLASTRLELRKLDN